MSDAPTTPRPSRVGPLLDLIHKLIEYGTQIAANLRQHGLGPNPLITARDFGTTDLALILARIARGLLRAAALKARLIHNAARLDAPSPRPNRRNAHRPAPGEATPQPSRRPSQTTARTDHDQALLAQPPTQEQIAAEIRHRPIGAVIADICRDFGIMPCHPLWRDLHTSIMVHGGNLAALIKDIFRRRLNVALTQWPTEPLPNLPAALLSCVASPATGPP